METGKRKTVVQAKNSEKEEQIILNFQEQEIYDNILPILQNIDDKCCCHEEHVLLSSSLKKLGFDSLEALSFVEECEKIYQIAIPYDDYDKFFKHENLYGVIKYIEQKKQHAPATLLTLNVWKAGT